MVRKKSKGIIVGYARKSKEDKNAKGISLDNQRARCAEYARARGCEFVYFEDNNKSGDNLNRPGYRALQEFIKTNKVECIILWQLDRITRNIEDYYGKILPSLREHKTTIASINQHFDDVFKLEPMILAVYLGVSAQELKNTKDRTLTVMEHRAKSGYARGKAPIGYLNVRDENKRGVIIPDPATAGYVKKAFELYSTGIFSEVGVGLELAKYGFVDKDGKPYGKGMISRILNRPLYMGKVPCEIKSEDSDSDDMPQIELFDGKHEAIVSEELFYRVQFILNKGFDTIPKGNVYTYSGFIKCAQCGYAYTHLLKHGAHNSGDYLYYHCTNHSKAHANERNVKEEVIDDAIQEVLESFDITDDYLKQIKTSVFKAVSELQAFEQESIKKLQEQYSKLTTIISNGIKQKLSGELEIDNTTYNELMNKWQEEKREISSKIANLSESTRDTMTRMNILADFANRVPELYLKATLEEKRMILTTITDKILIDSDNETITVKLKPIFEYLRQIKLQNRQAFSSNIETLNGTLETRSEKAKQGGKNIKSAINQIKDYGTRRMLLKTKIEPLDGSSMKFNVDGVTILEPKDKEIITQETSMNNMYQGLVSIMKQSTQEYYNMRMVLGMKAS